jgi:hypothetical protein
MQHDDGLTNLGSSDKQNDPLGAQVVHNNDPQLTTEYEASRSKTVKPRKKLSRAALSQKSHEHERTDQIVPESVNRSQIARPSYRTKREQLMARYNSLKSQKRDVATKNEPLQTREAEIGEEMDAVRDEIVVLLDTDGSEK